MKYFKKGIVLLLGICMLMAMVGCSKEEKNQSEQKSEKKAREETTTETEIATEEWGIIPQEQQNYYVVSSKMIDVKSGPLDEAPAIGSLHNGEMVPVTGTVGHWSRIIYSGCVCYLDSKYLQLEPPNDSETIVPATKAAEKETAKAKNNRTDKSAAENRKDNSTNKGESRKASASAQNTSSAAQTASKTSAAAAAKQTTKHTICIDPGHQKQGISEKEPNGPGSSEMKPKLAAGTQGTTTGVKEHVVNLAVSKLLKQELIDRGYEVVMIRETEDCPLSNAERAEMANDSGAELFIRIHANGSDDPNINGVVTFAPSVSNPYVGEIAAECIRLSQLVTDKICEATKAKNMGVQQTDTMTGINWCKIPVTIVEMGFMTNPTEDKNLSDPAYQAKIAKGIVDGIDSYFQ